MLPFESREGFRCLLLLLVLSPFAEGDFPSPCIDACEQFISPCNDDCEQFVLVGGVLSRSSAAACSVECTDYNFRDRAISELDAAVFAVGLEHVISLELRANDIEYLPPAVFSGLTALRYLGLRDNRIETLGDNVFVGLGALVHLNLRDNRIHESVLHSGVWGGLQSLTELDLDDNNIEGLANGTFHGLSALEELYLDGNSLHEAQIQAGAWSALQGLRVLDLDGNSFEVLVGDMFHGLGGLQELYLEYNTALATVQAGAFVGLDSLEVLSLEDSAVATIHSGAFAGLSRLIALNLERNAIVASTLREPGVWDGLEQLEVLQLDDNEIETVESGAFQGLSGLVELFMRKMSHLTRLEAGAFAGLDSLEVLDLDDCSVAAIEGGAFAGAPMLRSLILEDNNIAALSASLWEGLNSLRILDLDDNDLQVLGSGVFQGLSRLEDLKIKRNKLTSIEAGAFSGLAAAKDVELNDNALETLPAGAFRGLERLEDLDLSANALVGIVWEVLRPFEQLESLELDSNDGLECLPPVPPTVTTTKLGEAALQLAPCDEGLALVATCGGCRFWVAESDATLLRTGACAESCVELRLNSSGAAAVHATAFVGLRSVSWLDLSGNALPRVGWAVYAAMEWLEEVRLAGNPLQCRPPTPPSAALDLPGATLALAVCSEGLVEVFDYCAGCQFWLAWESNTLIRTGECSAGCSRISLYNRGIEHVQAAAFAGLEHTAELLLQDNDIESLDARVFGGLTGLEVLDLHGNDLEHIPAGAFADLRSLRLLDLQENSLRELPDGALAGMPQLVRLDLSGNELETLQAGVFSGLTSLELLEAEDAGVQVIEPGAFAGLGSLLRARLSHNQMWRLANGSFDGLGALDRLELEDCPLADLEPGAFSGLPQLTRLYLERTRLSVDSLRVPGVWAGLAEMKYLDMEGTSLQAIPTAAFVGLDGLIEMDLSDCEVESLAAGAFDGLASLEVLELDDNRIEALVAGTFRSLAGLRLLDLDDNDIDEIEPGAFEGLDTLYELSLEGNRISEETLGNGTFAGLDQCWVLDLDENRVGRLSSGVFAGLGALKELDIKWNLLEVVEAGAFIGVEGLVDLDFEGNVLGELETDAFAGLPSLEWLWLDDLGIHTIHPGAFNGLEKLRILWLNSNDLTSDALRVDGLWAGLGSLTELNLAKNLLQVVDLNLTAIPTLHELTLRQNNISAIQEGSFAGLANLEILDLRQNALSSEAVWAEVFTGLDGLKDLDLCYNSLHRVGRAMFNGALPQLDFLDLCGNGIAEIEEASFAGLPLTTLQMDQNDLSTAALQGAFDGLDALEVLDLAQNAIQVLPTRVFEPLSSLRELILRRGVVHTIAQGAFWGLALLEKLDLEHNNIQDLPPGTFAGLDSLTWLDLGDENLTRIAPGTFCGLAKVETLYLDTNSIEKIEPNAFLGLDSLLFLSLLRNQIEVVERGGFAGLGLVQQLNLDHNKLHTLDFELTAPLESLQLLAMADNPWACLPWLTSATSNLKWQQFLLPECLPEPCRGGGIVPPLDPALGAEQSEVEWAAAITGVALPGLYARFGVAVVATMLRTDAALLLETSLVDAGQMFDRGEGEVCWCWFIEMCFPSAADVLPPAAAECPRWCGNGAVEAWEGCDDGNGEEGDACLGSCEAARCGDGVVWVGVEECDVASERCVACACSAGFEGIGSGDACVDVDECAALPAACGANAACSNTEGSFACACEQGWRAGGENGSAADGAGCLVDVDECAEGAHGCHPVLGACTNIPGSYSCECEAGSDGDGVDCNAPPNVTGIVVEEYVFNGAENETFNAAVTFVDRGDDGAHVVALDWGCSGANDVEVVVPPGENATTLSFGVQYEAGVYPICASVADSHGQGSTEELDEVVAVYFATDGYVAGGGWYTAADAVVGDAEGALLRKHSVGYNVRYDGLDPYPTGHLRLKVQEGHRVTRNRRRVLKFVAHSFDWLAVVSAAEAKFQGTGRLAKTDKDLKFMVTLQDLHRRKVTRAKECVDDGRCDAVRVKIWDPVDGAIVYDNQAGQPDAGWAATGLTHGRVAVTAPTNPAHLALRPLDFYLDPSEPWRVANGGEGGASAPAMAVAAAVALVLFGAVAAWRRRKGWGPAPVEAVAVATGVASWSRAEGNCSQVQFVEQDGRAGTAVAEVLLREKASRTDRDVVWELSSPSALAAEHGPQRHGQEPGGPGVASSSSGPDTGLRCQWSAAGAGDASARSRQGPGSPLEAWRRWRAGPLAQGSSGSESLQADSQELMQDASGIWQGVEAEKGCSR